jgi:NADPH2:quinone reductase
MRAIRVHEFGGPEVLRAEESPVPQLAAGQVLVRVKAAGVNPVETYMRSGTYAIKPSLPWTPGSDSGGIVEAVGDGAGRYKHGDRVYTVRSVSGTYAELALCDLSHVYPLPENATFTQGAALGVPYATAARGLFHRGHALPGETLLVHGASGGVGTAAVQMARAHGMTVIGTAGTDKGLRLIRQQGATHALNHHDPKYLDQVRSITGGRGVDIILEMLANVNLGKDLTLLAPRGRVVVIGSRGTVEINPRDTMGRDADIRGMTLFNTSQAELDSIHAAIRAGLETGTLDPVISQEIPLAEAARAHQAVMAPGAYGKIVLVP